MPKFKVGDLVYSNYLPSTAPDNTICKVLHYYECDQYYVIEVPEGWPLSTQEHLMHIPVREGWGGWHVEEDCLTLYKELSVAERVTNKFLEMQHKESS